MTHIKVIFKYIKDDKKLYKEFMSTFKINKNDSVHKKIKFYLSSE